LRFVAIGVASVESVTSKGVLPVQRLEKFIRVVARNCHAPRSFAGEWSMQQPISARGVNKISARLFERPFDSEMTPWRRLKRALWCAY
jgi:hypothetical protein